MNILHILSAADLCIIGSDEVFNCLNAGEWGFTSQLFGNVSEANHIITYAASCGATTFDKLPVAVRNVIKSSFERVADFSTRDENTCEFVSHFINGKVNQSLPKLPKHFCVVYSYRNRINDKAEIEMIKIFCKDHSLIPIAVGAPQYWIKNFIICTPFQCLKIFGEADFIITDTFHGTIFSYKYGKKFAVIERDSNRNKLSDLVNKLNIEKYVVTNGNIADMYINDNNRAFDQQLIDNESRKTIIYLRKHIQDC